MSINENLFPLITPLPTTVARPKFSVIIPVYNRLNYLVDCLESILSQELPLEKMQILAIDDCSSVDVKSVVDQVGKGRIEYYRNDHNLGNAATFNRGINLAKGEWIHILHDDDWVMPNFYQKIQAAIAKFSQQTNQIGAICCRYVTADANKNWLGISQLHLAESGILPNWLYPVATNNPIAPPSVVIKRAVYEHLGGFHCGFISSNSEDWDLYKRVAVFYDWWFEPEVLACYRQHNQSITSQGNKAGLRIADLRANIEMSYDYLPLEIRDQITAAARQNYALIALKRGLESLEIGELDMSLAQIQEGLKISSQPLVVNLLFKEVLTHANAEPLRQAIAELLIDL
ncbi:MAG: glycosyltransferase family 2 protein [Pseudanabaena sp. ELA607]|jgi:glycosyltransferase involved in cell wall biosynthesis